MSSLHAGGLGNAAPYPAVWQGSGAVRGSGELPPVRPSLSPALFALVCAWTAVLLAQHACLERAAGSSWLGMEPRVLLCVLGICAVLACMAAGAAAPRLRVALLLAATGFAAGLATGGLSLESTLNRGAYLQERAVSAYRFLIETDPQPTASGGWRFEARVHEGDARVGRVWVDVACAVELDAAGAPLLPGMGSVVELVGRWKPLDPAEEFDASLLGRGVCARLSAMRVASVGVQAGLVGTVRSLRAVALDAVEPYSSPARALAAGVVCGMQAALSAFEASEDFAQLGLSHLVAVSGSHLALVAALLGACMGRVRLRPSARCACLVSILALYVAFTGFQPSAVRSWVMAAFAITATVVGRRGHAVSAVSMAALAMLLFDPSSAQNMGFTLSVLSVVGLTVFASYAQAWVRVALPKRTPPFIVESLALTGIAQAATTPVALPAFGSLALAAPLANVLVGPLVSLLLVFGLFCIPLACLVPVRFADVLMLPCDMLAGVSCAVARWLAGVPGTALMVEVDAVVLGAGVLVAATLLYACWPTPARRPLLLALLVPSGCLVCALLFWRYGAPPRVVVLDVGQGDAILIQDGPNALLVDTGPNDAVCYALTRNRVPYLDAVLLTHTDSDHAGGLGDLAKQVGVGMLYLADGVMEHVEKDASWLHDDLWRAGVPCTELLAGDVFEVGRFSLEVLWPQAPVSGSENEDSLVMLLAYRPTGEGEPTFSALLTGDAEDLVLDPLAERGQLQRVDVLKLGHHGSAVSTSPLLLDALDPIVAVASAGANNRYGHPTEACLKVCAEAGVRVLCTADVGDVAFYVGEGTTRLVLQRAA